MRVLLAILVLLTTLPCDGQVRRRVLSPRPGGSAITWWPTNASTPLVIWFEANNISGVSEGGSVSNWPNAGVCGFPLICATNSTVNEKPFLTNSVNGTTNHGVVFGYTYTNVLKVINAGFVSSNVASLTIAAICTYTNTGGEGAVLWLSVGTTTTRPRLDLSLRPFIAGPSAQGTTADGDLAKSLHSEAGRSNVCQLIQVDGMFSSGTMQIYVNSTFFNGTNLVSSGNTSSGVQDNFLGGGNPDYTYQYGEGIRATVAEVMVWKGAISAADRNNLWLNYAKPKYNLPPL